MEARYHPRRAPGASSRVQPPVCYNPGMVRTLEIAISKAAELSEAAQEQLGREMLERIDSLAELRAALEIGIRQLDAGEGKERDIEEVIRRARTAHAKG